MLVEHDRRLVAVGDQPEEAVLRLVKQAGGIEFRQPGLAQQRLVSVAGQRALEVLVRELVLVAEDDRVLRAGEDRQRLVGVALRRLVEDHHVENVAPQREHAAGVLGPHDPAREDLGKHADVEVRRVLEFLDPIEALG